MVEVYLEQSLKPTPVPRLIDFKKGSENKEKDD